MTSGMDPNAAPNAHIRYESPFPGPPALCGTTNPNRPCLDAGCRQSWCVEHQAAVALALPEAHVEAHQWITAGAEANPGIVFSAIGGDYMITAEYHRGGGHDPLQR